ncbi:hypothetical protein [uncultured Ilyobacter sp.]|uniref:hypothetical protein n=1 Tax=uncultured Ilyobacter sp. TaxID=544433 RepID=UPI0029F4C3CD|nr:hypothetical protein [uncultured Ilyobacter sp.]
MKLISMLHNIREIRKNMTLPREDIIKIQNSKLEKIIEHVLKNSNFYKRYYEKYGITLDNFREVPFENYPLINKEILKNNFDDILCTDDINKEELENFVSEEKNWCKKYMDKYMVITSSGSTGSPSIFVYDNDSWDVIKAIAITRTGKYQPMEFFRKHRISFIGATLGSFAAVTLLKDLSMRNYLVKTLDASDPLDENIKALNQFKPDTLSGYSSSVSDLAREQINGNLNIAPKKIICSADLLSPEKRAIITEAFKSDPVNLYAASESLGVASQIPGRDELYLFEDFYKIELVDSRYEEVSPGKTGEIILTNLFNYTLPLIRYEMEDQLKKSSCQDFNFTLVDEVIGRSVENLTFEKKDGTRIEIHGLQFVSMYFKGVKKVQYIQEDRNTLIVKYTGKNDLEIKNDIFSQISKLLEQYNLKESLNIKIERVNEIASDPFTEKYKTIIPYTS